MKIRVKVPATSANLGAGFDVFGLAVNLYNEFIIEHADTFSIEIQGAKNNLPESEDNLFYTSFGQLFKKRNEKVPPVKITAKIQIPQARGLGSSSTAVVGGLVAANAFLGNIYTIDELLPFAVDLERGQHPDNVAPALLGGLIAITSDEGKLYYQKLQFPSQLLVVYFVPEVVMDTVASRKLMPKQYLRKDVVFSTGRVALFLSALQSRQYHYLKIAMQDRIHQPTRSKIFPLFPKLIETAIGHGAYGAALSGGGSSVIAFADGRAKKVANAMQKEAEKNNISGIPMILSATNDGVQVTIDEL